MKCFVPLAICLLLGLWLGPAQGQDSATRAAAIAAQQDFEERYRRLLGDVEDLKEANILHQKRLSEIVRELQQVQEEASGNTGKFATREDLAALADKMRELDRKREDDQKLVLRELEKLAKSPPTPGGVSGPSPRTTAPQGKGFEYTIKPKDSFSAIVEGYNQDFKDRGIKGRITVKQLMDANPGVNPAKLKVGQKIFVPDPSQP